MASWLGHLFKKVFILMGGDHKGMSADKEELGGEG